MVALALVACSSSSSKPAGTDGGAKADASLNIGCVPTRCEVSNSCGVVDDGCGGKAPCGACQLVSTDLGQGIGEAEESSGVAIAFEGSEPVIALATDEGIRLLRPSAGSWSSEQVSDERSDHVALALLPGGEPVVAYVSRSGVMLARRQGSDWQTEEVAQTLRGGSLSLALDQQGRPHLAYLDVIGLAFKAAHWDGGRWQLETIEEVLPLFGDVNSSLAVDDDGTLHLLFAKDHQLLRYGRRSGSSWQLETLSSAFAGRGNALLFDHAGRLHLAHYDAQALRYLRRDGDDWTRETISDACDEGRVALTFDRVGRLHAVNGCGVLARRDQAGWTTRQLEDLYDQPVGLQIDERSLPWLLGVGDSGGRPRVWTEQCGGCTEPRTCGGGGEANVCGCTPRSCTEAGAECGAVAEDGCGGQLFCGWCASDFETCGGGGEANVCGCTPLLQGCADRACGDRYDGCGKTYVCGDCLLGSCGGGGTIGVCGCPTNGTVGPVDPTQAANDDAIAGQAWSDVTQVFAPDIGSVWPAPASGTAWVRLEELRRREEPKVSNYLLVTGFDFGLPADAVINGIIVEVKRASSGGSVADHEVRLVKGGKPIGENRAHPRDWDSRANVYHSYGRGADLWGYGWTPADLASGSGFGVAIAVRGGSERDDVYALVDHVRVKVVICER